MRLEGVNLGLHPREHIQNDRYRFHLCFFPFLMFALLLFVLGHHGFVAGLDGVVVIPAPLVMFDDDALEAPDGGTESVDAGLQHFETIRCGQI